MSLKYVLGNIKKRSWYKQGGALLPFFIDDIYICMYKEIGNDNVFVVQKGFLNSGYFEKLHEKKNAEIYLNKYLKDTNFLKKRIKVWKRFIVKQQKRLKQIMKLKFNEDEKLKKLIKEFLQNAVKAWTMAMVIEVFDPWGDHYIKEYSSKYNLSEDEIAILTSPDKLTYLQEEILDRYKIVKSKNLNKIKQHYNKYYWYLTSWQHAKIINEKYFEKLIKDNIKSYDKLKKEVKEMLKHVKDIKKGKKEIVKKHKIDLETQRVFRFFSELNDWRDIRKKEGVCKVNYELWIFLKKLCKRNKLNLNLGSHIIPHELNGFKISKSYINILKKRAKEYYVMYFNENDKLCWTYGRDAKKIFNALEEKIKSGVKEIKGRTAFLGNIRGKVKIVNNINEFSKIKKGDILVSIMTRPEMIPVMKKAAGIITDEGGITCHAAIVSRELKIPCIVGTQVATSVLKDRDLIEINGKTGVIKVIR